MVNILIQFEDEYDTLNFNLNFFVLKIILSHYWILLICSTLHLHCAFQL